MHAFSSRNNYSAVLRLKHWQKNEDSCNLFELRHSRMNGQQCFFSLRRDFFPLGRCIHKGISFYVLWYATKRARQRCQIVQTLFSAAARLLLLLCQQNNSHFLIAKFLNVPYNTPYSYLLYQERYCKNQAGMRGDGHSQKYFRRFNKWQHQKRIS